MISVTAPIFGIYNDTFLARIISINKIKIQANVRKVTIRNPILEIDTETIRESTAEITTVSKKPHLKYAEKLILLIIKYFKMENTITKANNPPGTSSQYNPCPLLFTKKSVPVFKVGQQAK